MSGQGTMPPVATQSDAAALRAALHQAIGRAVVGQLQESKEHFRALTENASDLTLVSGDLRRPMIAEFFGLSEEVGLTSVLLGQRTLMQAVLPVPGFDRLSLLPAGPLPSNPTEMLNSADAENMFAQLRDHFDLVLIDSPPVLPVTDTVKRVTRDGVGDDRAASGRVSRS